MTDSDKVQERWKEHIADFYDKNNRAQEDALRTNTEEDDKGPPIHFSELEAALIGLKYRKAEGKDEIPTEKLRALGVKRKRELCDICNEIYVRGEWPDDYLPARRSDGGICYGNVAGWLSVTRRYYIKTIKPILKLFQPPGSTIILVSNDRCDDSQLQGEPLQRGR